MVSDGRGAPGGPSAEKNLNENQAGGGKGGGGERGRRCQGGEVGKDGKAKQTDIYIKIKKYTAAIDFCPVAQQSARSGRSISQILVAAIDYPRIHWETCQPLGPAFTSQDK